MPVGERAALGARRQVGAEPLLLRGTDGHVQIAVEHDDVPIAQLIGVIALARVPCRDAEIVEIARRSGHVVFVVAGNRVGAPLVAPPRGRIAAAVVPRSSGGVRIVTEREYRTRDAVEQFRRRRRIPAAAGGDVPRTDKDLRRACGLDERGERVRALLTVLPGHRHPDGVPADGRIDVRHGHRP